MARKRSLNADDRPLHRLFSPGDLGEETVRTAIGDCPSNLLKAVEKAANDGVRKVGADIQRSFDRVHRAYGGKPVSNVRTALRSEMRRSGFTPDRHQLDSWAKAISDGTHITVQVDDVRL